MAHERLIEVGCVTARQPSTEFIVEVGGHDNIRLTCFQLLDSAAKGLDL